MSWKKANNKRRTAFRGPKPRKRVPYWERIVQKGYRVDGTVFYYKDPRWPGYIEGTSYIVRHEAGYVRSILIEGMGLIEGPIAGFKPMTDEEREASIASLKVLFEPPPPLEGLNMPTIETTPEEEAAITKGVQELVDLGLLHLQGKS